MLVSIAREEPDAITITVDTDKASFITIEGVPAYVYEADDFSIISRIKNGTMYHCDSSILGTVRLRGNTVLCTTHPLMTWESNDPELARDVLSIILGRFDNVVIPKDAVFNDKKSITDF